MDILRTIHGKIALHWGKRENGLLTMDIIMNQRILICKIRHHQIFTFPHTATLKGTYLKVLKLQLELQRI